MILNLAFLSEEEARDFKFEKSQYKKKTASIFQNIKNKVNAALNWIQNLKKFNPIYLYILISSPESYFSG